MFIQRALLRKSFLTHLTLIRSLAGMRSQMDNQIFPYAKRLAAYFANMRLLTRMYTHVNLQVPLAAHGFSAQLARHLILARVLLEMHLQRGFPVALKIANIALVLFPLAVRFHVYVEIRRARVRGVTYLTYKRLLAAMREQVPFQRLIRIKTLAANIAMYYVFFIVLLFM